MICGCKVTEFPRCSKILQDYPQKLHKSSPKGRSICCTHFGISPWIQTRVERYCGSMDIFHGSEIRLSELRQLQRSRQTRRVLVVHARQLPHHAGFGHGDVLGIRQRWHHGHHSRQHPVLGEPSWPFLSQAWPSPGAAFTTWAKAVSGTGSASSPSSEASGCSCCSARQASLRTTASAQLWTNRQHPHCSHPPLLRLDGLVIYKSMVSTSQRLSCRQRCRLL